VQAGERHDALVGRLTALAALDPLTGLATRRVLDAAADEALASGTRTALLVLDLDRFKQINDSRGHPVGDDALAHVAGLLRSRERAGTLLCRLGGDELAVLVTGCAAATAAEIGREAVRLVRTHPLTTSTGPVALSVSVGVAHAGEGVSSLRELYAAADAALYRAKEEGRDRVVVAGSAPEADLVTTSDAPAPHG
jgi:diguanylate cyclase (GGDEF)-like protein